MNESNVEVQRLGRNRYLHRVIPILDSSGKIVQRIVKPLMVEFRARDLAQVVVGSAVLAIPAAYTEEAWDLGATLPVANVAIIATLSMLLIAVFVYFNFYRGYFRGYMGEYFKRVIAIYLVSFVVVAILLTTLTKAPWVTEPLLAIKRTIIVAFPASMSAVVTDSLK